MDPFPTPKLMPDWFSHSLSVSSFIQCLLIYSPPHPVTGTPACPQGPGSQNSRHTDNSSRTSWPQAIITPTLGSYSLPSASASPSKRIFNLLVSSECMQCDLSMWTESRHLDIPGYSLLLTCYMTLSLFPPRKAETTGLAGDSKHMPPFSSPGPKAGVTPQSFSDDPKLNVKFHHRKHSWQTRTGTLA